MRIIQRTRRNGKTTEAVNWFREAPDRVLIVHNEVQKKWIVRQFHLTSKQQARIVLWDQWSEWSRGRDTMEVGIDQADWILQSFLGRHKLTLGTFDE